MPSIALFRCRFVNDVLHIRESGKDLFRRAPVEGTHREVVVFVLPYGELLAEVVKGIELVRSVEVFIVLAMAALDLAVMARCVDPDELVPDPQLVERFLKERRTLRFGAGHPGRELRTIVRLDAFDHIGELLHAMADKLGGGIGVVVFEGLQVTEATVFINKGVLVIEAAVLGCVVCRTADQS